MNFSRLIIIRIATVFGLIFSVAGFLHAQQSSPDVHTFTAKNGKTMTARVLGVSGGKVSIVRLSDGKNFQLPANSLSTPDVAFLKAWLKRRELMGHPAGWKTLRVELPEYVDTVEALGIPSAFRRVGLHTWEAELPDNAWILVRLWRRSGDWYAPEFLLPYDGQAEWRFTYLKSKLYRASGAAKSRPVVVGIAIDDDGGKEQLKTLKEAIPESGVCIFAGFLDDADFDLLGSKTVFSFVVRKIPRLSVAGSKIRAIRVIRDLVSYDGLSSLKELECLDITQTGDFPLGDVSALKSLTTLVADGNVTLGPAIGDSAWPSLRYLSLQRADIEDADKFGDFVAGLPELESLALPDENEMNVKGLVNCPKLSVLRLGDECYDPQVAGLKGLKQLRTVWLSETYNASELVALAEEGLFAKVTSLKTHVELPFSKLPLLSHLNLTGDQDDLDMGVIASIPDLRHLEVAKLSEDDLQALQTRAADLKKLSSLSIRFPRITGLTPLAKLPALRYLRVYEQFGSSEQDLKEVDVSGFPALQGLTLIQLQNLAGLKVAGGASSLQAISIRQCGELKSVSATGLVGSLAELVIANCESLATLPEVLNASSLKILHLADSPQLKKGAAVESPKKWQRLYLMKAGAFQ
ncbi:MAG: hypothetical protein L3J39_09670 [Verrucomicrobiales bacterium]|nr:hypothetical protein [Verrucomicrobiales bacterium]